MTLHTAHNVPDCRSDSAVKGVAGGRAVGEFRGLVYVAPGAQRTDARQQSRNILLSREARITTQPQLEIYACLLYTSFPARASAGQPASSVVGDGP